MPVVVLIHPEGNLISVCTLSCRRPSGYSDSELHAGNVAAAAAVGGEHDLYGGLMKVLALTSLVTTLVNLDNSFLTTWTAVC